VARLIGAASDITLVMNGDGIILDTAFQSGQRQKALNDSAGWAWFRSGLHAERRHPWLARLWPLSV